MAKWSDESVRRFRGILALVSNEQVLTAYDVANRLKLPLSSTYHVISELERLSCITRDENGYLLLGALPLQMALDMLGFAVSAHRLAPLVRHLRDQCGETAFVASLEEVVSIGTVAMGYRPGALVVQPSQTYRLQSDPPAWNGGVFQLKLAENFPYGDLRHTVYMTGIQLQQAKNCSARILVAGVARAEEPLSDIEFFARCLNEIRSLFDKRKD
uniref:hypothetical protein n=1 Tax=uncultured Acidovorax sp. TaxID=158751 RepID=UPI000A5D1CCD|nr:hypothetical protein [uncultured Acidovorax sp.]